MINHARSLVVEGAGDRPFWPLSERICRFRDASRARAPLHLTGLREANRHRAFFELYRDRPFWERYARSMAYALENQQVYLFEDEQLVGMLYPREREPLNKDRAKQARSLLTDRDRVG